MMLAGTIGATCAMHRDVHFVHRIESIVEVPNKQSGEPGGCGRANHHRATTFLGTII